MKTTLKQGLIAFLSAFFLVAAVCTSVPAIVTYADSGNITCEKATGNYLNEDYLSIYKVPTSLMTYENNGGAANGNPLSNAFDGKWNTFWRTNTENNGQQNQNPSFLNAITVTFQQAVTIESIVYASSSEREGHGYPISLNVYTANGGALSLYGTCDSTPTNDRVVFKFKEAQTVTQVKFEFRKVNTWHNWTATAKEIQFLQPDNADANKVLDLFTDYAQLTVKDTYKTSLSGIREKVSNLISYESAIKPLLDRADKIASGELKKESRREFSTDENAENVIHRYGNLRAYAGNTLKMSNFGINRQVLGVGGKAGDTITIYVEAPEGDPLPQIAFNQIKGDWRSWQSTVNLTRGKNVFTFPNFITSNYSWQTTPGGAVHIINPYEPSQQSSNVKIYVEGGFLYPVFRKGDDVDAFRTQLTEYCNEMKVAEGAVDITELVGDHFLHTVSANTAYNDFITRKVSPQTNAERWDTYLSAFLEFDGVSLTPDGEHYDEKNLHLYTNFRVVQPWGGAGAFSAGDHIGFIQFGTDGMTNFGTPGWGVAHEIGHAMDCTRREISETTNNMWSKFELVYSSKTVSRNQNDWITNKLTPDETALDFGLFNKNREVYQIWWNIESYFQGYWGRLDNNYRYYDETAARTAAGVTSEDGNLTGDERMVYFSSLATGVDLGHYFERCSFSFSSDGAFRLANTTNAYKKLVQKAIADGVLKDENLKLWYLDPNQYFFDTNSEGCYNSSSSVEILSAEKTSAGYTLYLPQPDDSRAHLGYEIMEYRNGNWYVIGFTYSVSYTDATAYEDGYVPQYKIRAYDRKLNCTAESVAKTFAELKQTDVCRIGSTYYDSLSEAVTAASAGDTIYVCANLFDVGMTIDKNLTLLPDPSVSGSVVINKTKPGALITVNGGITLTIGSSNGATIVLEGNKFSQNGTLVKLNGNGKLIADNVEFRNNINTDHAGALFLSAGGSVAEILNSTFKNNSVTGNDRNGGAIANFNGTLTLTDCTLIGNSSNSKGGAITVDGKVVLTRCIIKDNSARLNGGALYIACNGNDRTVTIEGGEISGNTAGMASAIYHEKGILTLVGGDDSMVLEGEIHRHSVPIRIEKALPDLSWVTFHAPNVEKGTVLLTANGDLTFTEAFAKALKMESADAYLGEGNKTILLRPWPTVSFETEGSEQKLQIKPGDFVLPYVVAGLEESKFVTQWEFNGKLYAAGETVEIDGDCKLVAVAYGTKYLVTVDYGQGRIHTAYVVPNDDFTLDECTAPFGKRFLNWEIDGKTYKVGDTVKITGDTVITAKFTDAPEEIPEKPSEGKPNGGKLSPGTIAGIVIAVVVVVGGGIAVAVIFLLKRKKGGSAPQKAEKAPVAKPKKTEEKPATAKTKKAEKKPTATNAKKTKKD